MQIRNLKLIARESHHKSRKYVEVQILREVRAYHLIPSNQFDVTCDLVGGSDVLTYDYLLWTSVDFVVGPVRHALEEMSSDELASSISWGQVAEMNDLKAIPVYALPPTVTRHVIVEGLKLGTVLAAFPVRNAGDLWPWLFRVTVHVQDRSGKQIATAQTVLRMSPNSMRKTIRYDDPLPSR